MLISWDDLGRPAQTGDYAFQHILVRVDQDAISIWRTEPSAVFHVETHAPAVGVGVFVLGQWEVPFGLEGEH